MAIRARSIVAQKPAPTIPAIRAVVVVPARAINAPPIRTSTTNRLRMTMRPSIQGACGGLRVRPDKHLVPRDDPARLAPVAAPELFVPGDPPGNREGPLRDREVAILLHRDVPRSSAFNAAPTSPASASRSA